MSARSRKYNSNLSFVDLLFNMLLGFIVLFVIAFILINPPDPNKKVDPKAEFLITMDWPDHAKQDIDLWLKVEPILGNPIFAGFSTQQNKYAHLDRDDLGDKTDVSPLNREVIAIRTLNPATYTVSTHYYANHGAAEPVELVIEVVKLNSYNVITTKIVTINAPNDEVPIIQFRVEEDGSVTVLSETPDPILAEHIKQVSEDLDSHGRHF